MVHSPPLMLEGGKRGKKKREGSMIRSPPPLNSSIFDSEYFPTNKRQNHENVNDIASSLLCNNNGSSLGRSSNKGQQQHKSIAFADLIPKHTPFGSTESPRKVGLTPRLNRRRRDGSQCNNNVGPLSEKEVSDQIDLFPSSKMLEPSVASPQHHVSTSSLLSSSTTNVFSQQRLGQGLEEEEQRKFDDFALTPTCLYGEEDDEEESATDHNMRRPQSVPIKRYHRSPHWSGRVNINPFSPVPQQYLNPPSSAMPASRPILGDESQGALLPAGSTRLNSPKQKKRKRARLSPKKAGPSLLNPRVSNLKTSKGTIGITSPVKKRRASVSIATNDDEITTQKSVSSISSSKRLCLPNQRSRYLEDFEEIQFLGSGSFGAVCACLSRLDGCMYAVKSISPDGVTPRTTNFLYGGRNSSNTSLVPPTPRRDGIPSSARRNKTKRRTSRSNDELSPQMALRGSKHWSENTLNRMLREVFALAALCNQSDLRTFHIVRYHQAWLEDDGNLYIQTELCKSTLRDEMDSGGGMDISRQFKILREVLLALQLVHEQGCVHLDIKPHNIFVKDDMYKLGDFGTATLRDEINAKTGEAMDVEEGDSRYMPRDLLEGTPDDLTKCDIFSLGITLYETCIDRPLPICGQEWQDLRNGKLSNPDGINPTFYAIIKQMMHLDPSKRPTASDLLARSELSADSNNVFLPQASSASSSKGARPLPLKRERSLSWT